MFDAGVRVLEKLIETGIASGEFYCENPKGAASNIMYVLEGMKQIQPAAADPAGLHDILHGHTLIALLHEDFPRRIQYVFILLPAPVNGCGTEASCSSW